MKRRTRRRLIAAKWLSIGAIPGLFGWAGDKWADELRRKRL